MSTAILTNTGTTAGAGVIRRPSRRGGLRALVAAALVTASVAGITIVSDRAEAATVITGNSYSIVGCTRGRLAISPYANVQTGYTAGQNVSYRVYLWSTLGHRITGPWSNARKIPYNNYAYSSFGPTYGTEYVTVSMYAQWRVWVEVIHWRQVGSSWTYAGSGWREASYQGYNGAAVGSCTT